MDLVTPHLGLLFWQTITFIILIVGLTKFAWKPIAQTLRERENTIDQAINAAENARLELVKMQASNEKLLQDSRLERDKVLKDAHNAASNMINEAKEKATAEAERLILSAKSTIDNEKKAALTEIKSLSANLAIQIAEKLLKKELSSDAAQNKLVEEYIKDVNLN